MGIEKLSGIEGCDYSVRVFCKNGDYLRLLNNNGRLVYLLELTRTEDRQDNTCETLTATASSYIGLFVQNCTTMITAQRTLNELDPKDIQLTPESVFVESVSELPVQSSVESRDIQILCLIDDVVSFASFVC